MTGHLIPGKILAVMAGRPLRDVTKSKPVPNVLLILKEMVSAVGIEPTTY